MSKDSNKSSESGRNRSQGWTHAKRSGHRHESDIAERIQSDLVFANGLSMRCFREELGKPTKVSGGGASAEHIEDLFGAQINGKPDLYIEWSTKHIARISLKKSTGGQVFLTSVARFVTGFEKQFGVEVPKEVRTGLDLFIGGDKSRLQQALKDKPLLGPMHRRTGVRQEEHQTRLLAVTLNTYFRSEWAETLVWFNEKIGEIAEFVFARGHAKNPKDFASHIWYLDVGQKPRFDLVIPVARISEGAIRNRGEVRVGDRNGGSTIQLPFGFLQMHAPKNENLMQFHHNYEKVRALTTPHP